MAEIIFPFIALSIPIIGILAAVAMKWMKLKERQLEMQTSLSAEKAAQYGPPKKPRNMPPMRNGWNNVSAYWNVLQQTAAPLWRRKLTACVISPCAISH